MKVAHKIEAYTPDGVPLLRFTVMNSSGSYMEFTNWGARWITASVPDIQGVSDNVLIGYDTLSGYLEDSYYMGATIGRFANRIAGASFTIDGKTFRLEANDGDNSNHGGSLGFHNKVWKWEELPDGIRFSLYSSDGEGGFPGNIYVITDYCFNEDNELFVRHYVETDCTTYINMTNHAYFNLCGKGKKITEHWLQIPSDWILETTSKFIPTGRKTKVKNTPFDFTYLRPIGAGLHTHHEQLLWNKGYNHCYILKDKTSSEMLEAASLYEPVTGRKIKVFTDLPAVLLYTAGFYERPGTAVCLETQFYPDTPSHSDFPSCLVLPEKAYEQCTLFCFQVKKEK